MEHNGFSLLSHLWLKEAGEADLAGLETFPDLAGYAASPEELAVAYTDVFLLNVYPYASVFLDWNGEMNGQRSRELSALYVQSGCQPDSLYEAGAPDHIGLVLGLLARLPGRLHARVLSKYVLDWAPVLCFSIERQPSAHPFYRALAARTRGELFHAFEGENLAAQPPAVSQFQQAESGHPADPGGLQDAGYLAAALQPPDVYIDLQPAGSGEELSLSHLIHYLLCPARSGIFLSRAQLGQWARRLGLPLPFGERRRLAISLFETTGMVDRVPELLEWLLAEFDAWDAAYVAWAEEHPIWRLFAGEWRERIDSARALLAEARFAVEASP